MFSCTNARVAGIRISAAGFVALALFLPDLAMAQPWAASWLSYDPGTDPVPGFTSDPDVVLGSPERVTGELAGSDSDVTMFNSPFGTDEILSIGGGGELVVRFDEPVEDDPTNLFGVDMIIFGNTFFTTSDFVVGNITGDNREPADVEVSADGSTWFAVTPQADSLFPTQGFLDAEIFGTDAGFNPSGTIATNFLRPMDPSLDINDFLGKTYAQALGLYDGSGGGTPIDIGPTGLDSISFVRISVPVGGASAEIDAFANVPEPSTGALLIAYALLVGVRRRTRKD